MVKKPHPKTSQHTHVYDFFRRVREISKLDLGNNEGRIFVNIISTDKSLFVVCCNFTNTNNHT